MGDKAKAPSDTPLCKWKSGQYAKESELLASIVSKPAFVCHDCGRAAKQKKWHCKPERL